MKHLKIETTAKFATALFFVLLHFGKLREFALETLNEWSDVNKYPGWRYITSCNLQKTISIVTGGEICSYCRWNIAEEEPHGYCDLILKTRRMSDHDLVVEWRKWKHYPYTTQTIYDYDTGQTLETWVNLLYSELSERHLPWYDETYVVQILSPEELLVDTARLVVERNAAEAGLTLEQIHTGAYFKTCSKCGGRFWGEDGCDCWYN